MVGYGTGWRVDIIPTLQASICEQSNNSPAGLQSTQSHIGNMRAVGYEPTRLGKSTSAQRITSSYVQSKSSLKTLGLPDTTLPLYALPRELIAVRGSALLLTPKDRGPRPQTRSGKLTVTPVAPRPTIALLNLSFLPCNPNPRILAS